MPNTQLAVLREVSNPRSLGLGLSMTKKGKKRVRATVKTGEKKLSENKDGRSLLRALQGKTWCVDVTGLMALAVIPLPAETWLSQRTGIQLVQVIQGSSRGWYEWPLHHISWCHRLWWAPGYGSLREKRVVARGLCWPGWEMAEGESVQSSQGSTRVQPSWRSLLPTGKFRHVQLRGTIFPSCIRPSKWLHKRERQDIKDIFRMMWCWDLGHWAEVKRAQQPQEKAGGLRLQVPAVFTRVAIWREDSASPWEKQNLVNHVPWCPVNFSHFLLHVTSSDSYHLKYVVLLFHSLSFLGGGRCAKPFEEYMHSRGLGSTCEFLDDFLNFWIYLLLQPFYKLREESIILKQGGGGAKRFSEF